MTGSLKHSRPFIHTGKNLDSGDVEYAPDKTGHILLQKSRRVLPRNVFVLASS
jgi:hypothetical protein